MARGKRKRGGKRPRKKPAGRGKPAASSCKKPRADVGPHELADKLREHLKKHLVRYDNAKEPTKAKIIQALLTKYGKVIKLCGGWARK